jgi:hypothetical protein
MSAGALKALSRRQKMRKVVLAASFIELVDHLKSAHSDIGRFNVT